MLQFILVYLFCAFACKTYNTVFMFEIFHPEINTGLKNSLARLHMRTFIL